MEEHDFSNVIVGEDQYNVKDEVVRTALDGFSIRFVNKVPTEDETEPMTIYLIPKE